MLRVRDDDEPAVAARGEVPALLTAEVVEPAVDEPHRRLHPREVGDRVEAAHRPKRVDDDVVREAAGRDVVGRERVQGVVDQHLVETRAGVGQARDRVRREQPGVDHGAGGPGRAGGGHQTGDLVRVAGRVRDRHVATERQADDERPLPRRVDRRTDGADRTVEREPFGPASAMARQVDRDRPVPGMRERLDLRPPHGARRPQPVHEHHRDGAVPDPVPPAPTRVHTRDPMTLDRTLNSAASGL